MPSIRILSDETINKIAAGEVIENPASVVKELVENSIDAQATLICVRIQEGGRQLIHVSDDGCGMSLDNALLSLERHATSKISAVEDIEDLITMGFRGEALPSIAAISKFSLLTSPRIEEGQHRKEEGVLIIVDGGRLISCSSAARSHGTTIEVKSLFFNVPVRRKFQKSPSFDTQDILKMIGLLALAHPTIHFELISDQKLLLKTPLEPSHLSFTDLLRRRIECIMGKDSSIDLLPVMFQQDSYTIEGFISSPTAHKPNRTGQHLFINQRLVFSPFIASTIREGYSTMLPNHRYPTFVLHLRMPGSLLDVNVHPQKREVRLCKQHQLKISLIQAIQKALKQEGVRTLPEEIAIPPFWMTLPPPRVEEKWEFIPSLNPPTIKETPPLFSPPTFTLPPPLPLIVATIINYCILDPFQLPLKLANHQQKGGLALLDQRAAYRRIRYDQLLKRLSAQESQSLLIPITLQMTSSEAHLAREYLLEFNQMGFSLREFGENTFVIDAFPSFIKENQLPHYFMLILSDLIENQTSKRLHMQREEKLALVVCRTSLPTAKQLSQEEAQGLLQQLIACEMPAQCPLGKPTCLYFSPEEIGQWFQK